MAGRGGRGAQLLQALEMPARKPKNVGQYPEGKYHMNGAPQSGPGQQQYPGPRQSYAQQPQPGRRGGQYPVRGHYSPQGQYPPQGQYSQQQPQPNAQYPSQGQEHSPGQYSPQGQYPPQGSCPPQGQYPVRGSYQYGPPQAQQPGVYHAPGGRGSMQLGVQPRVPPPMGRGMMPQMPSSQPTGRPPSQTAGQPAYGRGAAVLASYGRDAPVNGQAQLSGMEAHVRQPHSTVQPCGRGYQPSPAPSKQFPLGPQQTVQPPTQALQEMTLREKSSAVLAPITQTGEKGTAGKTVPLAVNYIPIRCKVDGVYQYCVSYSPDVDSRNMRYKLLCDHADFLGGTRAFDGIALFLPRKLQDQPTILKSTRPTDGAEITLSIQMVKFLAPDQCVQLYNIIFRKVMRTLQMYQVGRYYYDPTKPAQIPQHKLELWPGYITTIQHYEGGLLLLADVSHRLLRTDTVLEFLYELYNLHKNNFQEVATKTLVGTVVLTRYNNKTYRIDDIEWNKNPQDTFLFHTGERMTYVDYYKKSYNKTLCDHSQPLLVHRPKKREQTKPGARRQIEVVNLIPELCSMTGLTDAMRQDFRLMKDVAAHTRVTPMQREESTRKFLNNVSSTPEAKKHLSDWGLELDTGLLKTEGRLLPMEKIKFGSTTVSANPQADWGRDAVKENVITPVGLTSWMIVFVKRDQHKAMDFIQTMKKVTPAMGISVQDPVVLELRDDRTETYVRTIREHLNRSVQVVVIVFPTSRDDRYAAVKKLCCVDFPVPSQVINARTISQQNKLRSVTQKIALQINCKVGGELWALDIPLKSLMVVGIDLYHDASQGGRSIGGFVASTNRSLTRWYSRVCFQSPGQELVAGLKMCLTSALKKFHEVNHTLPEKIIVFRDGVGDGQLNTVGEYEVSQLAECFALFGEKYEPQMTVIVVQKRINTRIFSYETRGGQHMLDNPGPGTVLDHSVTRKDWYDFFVVSQHVRQGTVTPTHYVVVHNSSSLKPDHIQRLSYKLTHLYYNWPGTVRVPAPCQYAHKLAYLVGTSIHKDPSVHLSERLFYL